jgi:hypothetical protein
LKVYELTPGDIVEIGKSKATFIARTSHPLFTNLSLVVWVLDSGKTSLDALSPLQDVGNAYGGGKNALRAALLEKKRMEGKGHDLFFLR